MNKINYLYIIVVYVCFSFCRATMVYLYLWEHVQYMCEGLTIESFDDTVILAILCCSLLAFWSISVCMNFFELVLTCLVVVIRSYFVFHFNDVVNISKVEIHERWMLCPKISNSFVPFEMEEVRWLLKCNVKNSNNIK